MICPFNGKKKRKRYSNCEILMSVSSYGLHIPLLCAGQLPVLELF